MNARFVFVVLAAGLLAACATPTPYQPVSRATDGPRGFAEAKIEADRYRVSFSGNSRTKRETVETYLLYRAAELTLERGFDYFITTERATEVEDRSYAVSTGFPRYGFFHRRHGFGRFPIYDTYETVPVKRYDAFAIVKLYSGEAPAGDPNAYDAREVIANLAPAIRRPEED